MSTLREFARLMNPVSISDVKEPLIYPVVRARVMIRVRSGDDHVETSVIGGAYVGISGLGRDPGLTFLPGSAHIGRTALYVTASSRRTRWKLARANRVKN